MERAFDRHFQKVKTWCSHFENTTQIVEISDVVDAIHKGSRSSNKSRVYRKKDELFCLAFECTAPHPEFLKSQVLLPGIQATHVVSYIRTGLTNLRWRLSRTRSSSRHALKHTPGELLTIYTQLLTAKLASSWLKSTNQTTLQTSSKPHTKTTKRNP